MRTIKISGGFSGKVATGSYENSSPYFGLEETIQDCTLTDSEVFERSQFLTRKCKEFFDEQAKALTIERIEKERKEIRFYERNGKKLPSVTAILNFDSSFMVSDEDLIEYASQGNITHARAAHLIETGEWKSPIELEACWADMHVLKKGKLGLQADSGDFQAFLAKYPIKDMKNGVTVFNDKEGYAGTPDFTGIPDFKGAEPILTLFDIKRSVDKVKNMCQMAAYAVTLGIEQVAIVPLNDDTEQRFSKPIVSKDVQGYYEMFLAKKAKFCKRYGI